MLHRSASKVEKFCQFVFWSSQRLFHRSFLITKKPSVSNGIFGTSLRIWRKLHNLLHLIYFKIQLILMNSGKIFIFHVLRNILIDLKYSDYFLVRSQQREVSSHVSWATYKKKMVMKYSSAPNQLTLIYCKQLNYSKLIFFTNFHKYLMSTDRG